MWKIHPVFLCKKHLIGEHGEIHKFLPSFRKGNKVHGRFFPVVQIQFQGYKARHDALAQEMLDRGYNHKSPLIDIPDFKSIYPEYYHLKIDIVTAIEDLSSRCAACAERMEIFHKHFLMENNYD